ncbi:MULTISPECIES: hypothetical protein [Arthrobacter]|uniref:Uncharacterized protein n=2 Tax=Arthrobacter TaxID=1663 RepID=A0ABU9KJ68_9MICC|nr:hypothetical protein [Arthrobacter sp. YJM1]MDP5226822.1 hypothetical protein [Arthrobacter sp. YJM1]
MTTRTLISSLHQLRRGDEVEAERFHLQPRTTFVRRGRVQDIAPGLGVVWIRDAETGQRRVLDSQDYQLWRLA